MLDLTPHRWGLGNVKAQPGDPDDQPDLRSTELKDLANTFSLCDCVIIECYCVNYSTFTWVIVCLSYCFSVFTCEFI